jgi:3-phenylpropionate/trans-cinnamate dioxygenase ferredoxin component
MTRLKFHDVASSGQIHEGVVRRVLVGELEVAVLRSSGRVYALSNVCTHEGCRLSNGRVTAEGLRCTCHGSLFSYETGEALRPPASQPIDVFAVKEENGRVWVGVDDRFAPSVTSAVGRGTEQSI